MTLLYYFGFLYMVRLIFIIYLFVSCVGVSCVRAQVPTEEWRLGGTFFVTDAEIGNDGRIYTVDKEQSQIRIFDSNGSLIHAVGRKGKGPGEFQEPLAVALSPDERMFAVRDENRRVSLFSRDGTYQQSFVLSNILPSGSASMTFVSDSLLAVGGFKPKSLYSGNVIHFYTLDGTPVSSFYGRTEKAKKLKVTARVGVGFDRYHGFLYSIQPVDYAISVFTLDGERTETIRISPLPDHFQPLTTPQPNPREDRAGALKWSQESDVLRRLFVLNEDLLLVTVQKLTDPDVAYWTDIIGKEDGRVVHSRPVEGWVVNTDPERGWIYIAEAQEDAPVTMLRAYRVEEWIESQ